MHFVPDPPGGGFASVGGISIVGRTDHFGRRRESVVGAQVRLAFDDFKLLNPDASQDLYRWKGSEPIQLWGRVDGIQEAVPVSSNGFDKNCSLGLIFGETSLFDTAPIELIPLIWGKGAQPVWNNFCQAV